MLAVACTGSNFGSISMEPFARGAGAASSFQACLTTLVSTRIGAVIGAQFNGTTVPLALCFLLCGGSALLIVLWAERGKLFTRPHLPKIPAPYRLKAARSASGVLPARRMCPGERRHRLRRNAAVLFMRLHNTAPDMALTVSVQAIGSAHA